LKINLLFLFTLAFFLSCNYAGKSKTRPDALLPINNDSAKTFTKTKNESAKRYLSPEKDTLRFNLKMDSANQHVTVAIDIISGKELFASLSSKDKNANIRISQIGLPDSTFDGPFGKTLDCKIKDTGIYKIIVGEDMMAGDRWKGHFSLKTWVK
jgi:hypothetical protein